MTHISWREEEAYTGGIESEGFDNLKKAIRRAKLLKAAPREPGEWAKQGLRRDDPAKGGSQ